MITYHKQGITAGENSISPTKKLFCKKIQSSTMERLPRIFGKTSITFPLDGLSTV
jgi:hypothetical protein